MQNKQIHWHFEEESCAATAKQTKGLCAWVPTNLRRHHSDVVPGCVFSVQRLCGPYRATDFINPEVPFVILFTVQEISVVGGKARTFIRQ